MFDIADGLAVIAVDFGAEFMKIAIVKVLLIGYQYCSSCKNFACEIESI